MSDQFEVHEEIEQKAVKLTTILLERLDSDKRDRERMARNTKVFRNAAFKEFCAQLEAIPAWQVEVKSANFWMWDGSRVEINVSLQPELTAPELPRELVRRGFATSLRKRKSYSGQSLIVNGDLIAPKVKFKISIEITGYVPATCTVVYEDVVIPERVERKAKIICDPALQPQDREDESAVEGTITAEG